MWFNYVGKKKGKNLEFYSTPLKESPLYYPTDKEELKYIENLVKRQLENYTEDTQNEIDSYFNKIMDIKNMSGES